MVPVPKSLQLIVKIEIFGQNQTLQGTIQIDNIQERQRFLIYPEFSL